MIIGVWVISIWLMLGIANIFIWKKTMDEEANDVQHIFNPDFLKRFIIIIIMVMSPYFLL